MKPKHLSKAAITLSLALLAGCQGGGGSSGSGSGSGSSGSSLPFTNSPTLLASYLPSLDSIRTSATQLLTQNARYRLQNAPSGYWSDRNSNGNYDSGVDVIYEGNPIEHAGIHYAHAAGLTGAGEVIAFTDSGFRTSHEAFAGKSITTGSYLPQSDHGTLVASVAAGNSSGMIGVAPDADVIFGSYSSNLYRAETANQAAAAGAVALNNSWGFTSLEANTADYNTLFGNSSGQTYLNALKNYALDGIVIFAVNNDYGIATNGLMPALPVFETDLEESWLAVINGVPQMNGDDIVSAERVSGACLEAGPWCLAASGFWTGAIADSDTSYTFGTGSSFAAPTVAGALALLAEAFPSMTHQQLRIRLLASADNDFAGFTQSGTTELAPDFEHAYSDEWGHGFLDVAAALLPIGQNTVTTGSGKALNVNEPLVVAGSASGDAVSKSLQDVEILSTDALSASFAIDAANLVARNKAPAILSLNDAFRPKDLQAASFSGTSFFGDSQGALLPFSNEETKLTLFHSQSGTGDRVAFGASRTFDFGGAELLVSTSFGDDTAALLSDWNGSSRASLASAGVALSAPLGDTAQLNFELGYALGTESSGFAPAADVLMNATAATYSQSGVFKRNDRLSLSLSLPAAITSGSTSLSLPVRTAAGGREYRNVPVNLAPSSREVRLGLHYQRPLSRFSHLAFSLAHADNHGNIAGQRETAAIVGISMRF